MSIKIIKEPDIELTQAELERLRYEYAQTFSFYSGPIPSFESWVRGRHKPTTSAACCEGISPEGE